MTNLRNMKNVSNSPAGMFVKRNLNIQGGISLLMVITLFIPWMHTWYVSRWNDTPNAFFVASDTFITWITIIAVIGLFAFGFTAMDKHKKDTVYGAGSFVILLTLILVYFTKDPDYFKSTAIGWKLMLVLSIAHIVIACIGLKKPSDS